MPIKWLDGGAGTAMLVPIHQRVFWGMAEGAVAAVLILLLGEAGLIALQQVITVVGLPVFVLVCLMNPSLLRGFVLEDIDHVTLGRRSKLEQFEQSQEPSYTRATVRARSTGTWIAFTLLGTPVHCSG